MLLHFVQALTIQPEESLPPNHPPLPTPPLDLYSPPPNHPSTPPCLGLYFSPHGGESLSPDGGGREGWERVVSTSQDGGVGRGGWVCGRERDSSSQKCSNSELVDKMRIPEQKSPWRSPSDQKSQSMCLRDIDFLTRTNRKRGSLGV